MLRAKRPLAVGKSPASQRMENLAELSVKIHSIAREKKPAILYTAFVEATASKNTEPLWRESIRISFGEKSVA